MDAANFNIDDHYPVRELWARARCCWTKILIHESKSVLVVAHNAVNQALVATAIGTVSHLIVNLVLYYVNCHFQCSFFFPFPFWQLGLGTEYFRILLQSNCGASVLDFTPQADGGPPYICLNRLNQVYGLMHRKFNMQIFTLFLLGCLVVFMSGPCQ